ncbi:glycosyltransferase family 4 protein [Chloroflexi bacterium TSY]|nr:glycosyltransferase family 4 protein [Chloroflexi bacterium TSY]
MNRPLNFLHLTTFYPPYSFGGDAMYIYRLAHMLGDAGHHVDIVHCLDAYRLLHPSDPEVEFDEHPRVVRHGLNSGRGWLSPFLTQQTGRAFFKLDHIKQLLQQKSYDVIHYHNISLLGPEILGICSQSKEAVKLYTTHEHWLVCPMHVLWKFNKRACEKPDCLRCVLKGKRPPQLWRYTGMVSKMSSQVDQYVSPSRFTATMHKERGFPQPVAHLPYFIERVDHEWQNPGPLPQETPYFLFVGRLEVIKGLQNLIQAWKHVSDYDLLVAGTGNYEAALREQAAGNPRIRFLGALSQRELGALYFHALACIVPSITYETFGMIIIEAFARKTPVIVHDLGALPEVVHDSNGGYIYKTEKELLTAIDAIATGSELRRKLGENGYQAFIAQWCPEAHWKMYFHYIHQAAKKKFDPNSWNHNSN